MDLGTGAARPARVYQLLFAIFCFIVFSKIAWYDLRVYVPLDARRDLMSNLHAGWLAAQLLMYAVLIIPLLRQAARQWRLIVFWVLAVTPYLAVGALEGRLDTFFVADVARYALPIGFLLFFSWVITKLSGRSILITLGIVIAFHVAFRTALHVHLSPGVMRYGVAWEVFLVCLLVSAGAIVRFWRAVLLAAAIAVLAAVLAFGLSRSMLLGSAIGALLAGVLSWRLEVARRAVPSLAVVGTIATLAPALFPAQTMSRLSVAGTVTTSDRALLAGALRDLATSGAGADSPGVPASGPGVDPASRQPSNGASARDRALYRWEAAVAGQTASLDSRITESLYFIEETRSSVRNLLFGAGAGWSVSIVASRQGELRVVRGAHNTYVTLVFRHGLVFGLPLIVFVLVFGLRRHLRQWRDAASPEWAVLLLALLAYRGAATIMAVFHQGLFDDPLVFLSIAAATTLPAPTGGGVDATLPGDARPPDHEYHRGVDHRP